MDRTTGVWGSIDLPGGYPLTPPLPPPLPSVGEPRTVQLCPSGALTTWAGAEPDRPHQNQLVGAAPCCSSPTPAPSCRGDTSIVCCVPAVCTSIRRGWAASATGITKCSTPLA